MSVFSNEVKHNKAQPPARRSRSHSNPGRHLSEEKIFGGTKHHFDRAMVKRIKLAVVIGGIFIAIVSVIAVAILVEMASNIPPYDNKALDEVIEPHH